MLVGATKERARMLEIPPPQLDCLCVACGCGRDGRRKNRYRQTDRNMREETLQVKAR